MFFSHSQLQNRRPSTDRSRLASSLQGPRGLPARPVNESGSWIVILYNYTKPLTRRGWSKPCNRIRFYTRYRPFKCSSPYQIYLVIGLESHDVFWTTRMKVFLCFNPRVILFLSNWGIPHVRVVCKIGRKERAKGQGMCQWRFRQIPTLLNTTLLF